MENNSPKVCCSKVDPSEIPKTLFIQQTKVIQSPTEAYTEFSKCGKSSVKRLRMTGWGENPALGDWPWIVALGYRTATNPGPQFKCGVSLISNKWIVTAAHCVSNIGIWNLTIARLGALDLNDDGEDKANHVDIPVDEIIPHPEYSPYPITNDIALIRLKNSVTFTKFIRPICILSSPEHKSDEFYSRKLPYIIGWGAVGWGEPTKKILQEVQIEIIHSKRCAQNSTNNSSLVTEQRVLCTENSDFSYLGDSGRPLIMPIESTYYLVGVLSLQ